MWLGKASSSQTSPILCSLGVATPSSLDGPWGLPQLKLIQCSLSFLLPLLLLTPKLPVFTGSMMTESVSYPTLRTLSPVFMYINVYSCGQTRHLPTSLRSFGRSFHLEAPRSMPELGLGLRSCLRHKGSYSFLGLLGTALLGGGGEAAALAEVNAYIGVGGACCTCLPNSHSCPQPQEQLQHWLDSVFLFTCPGRTLY